MSIRSINGFPIVDATKNVVIKITKRDATREGLQDPASCAVARACKRDIHAPEVRVHRSRIYVRDGDKWLRFIASRALCFEIVAFDRGGVFQPGEYLLQKPQPCQKLGAERKRGDRKHGKRGGKLVPRHVMENVRASPSEVE